MVTQLRDYRITEGSLHRFLEEWQTRIVPIRLAQGFSIDGAWSVEGESRFVWLLSHPGDWHAFEAADRAYYSSPQRTSLDPNPVRLIEQQAHARLARVELDSQAR